MAIIARLSPTAVRNAASVPISSQFKPLDKAMAKLLARYTSSQLDLSDKQDIKKSPIYNMSDFYYRYYFKIVSQISFVECFLASNFALIFIFP